MFICIESLRRIVLIWLAVSWFRHCEEIGQRILALAQAWSLGMFGGQHGAEPEGVRAQATKHECYSRKCPDCFSLDHTPQKTSRWNSFGVAGSVKKRQVLIDNFYRSVFFQEIYLVILRVWTMWTWSWSQIVFSRNVFFLSKTDCFFLQLVNHFTNVFLLSAVKPDRRLTLFYLANDVLQNSRKKTKDFITAFSRVLREAVPLLRYILIFFMIILFFPLHKEL